MTRQIVSQKKALEIIHGANDMIDPVIKMRAASLVVRGCKYHKMTRIVELFENFERARRALVEGISEIEHSFANRSIPQVSG